MPSAASTERKGWLLSKFWICSSPFQRGRSPAAASALADPTLELALWTRQFYIPLHHACWRHLVRNTGFNFQKILISGGFNGLSVISDSEIFNPKGEGWRRLSANMMATKSALSLVTASGLPNRKDYLSIHE